MIKTTHEQIFNLARTLRGINVTLLPQFHDKKYLNLFLFVNGALNRPTIDTHNSSSSKLWHLCVVQFKKKNK